MGWDALWFLGNVVGPTMQPVKFLSATTFQLAPAAIHMPTLATMEVQRVAAGAVPFLPQFGPVDTDKKLIWTQCLALLPFVMVHCCLVPISMWQLWTVLGQALLDGGQEVEMGVLLDWIQVASILSAPQVALTI